MTFNMHSIMNILCTNIVWSVDILWCLIV